VSEAKSFAVRESTVSNISFTNIYAALGWAGSALRYSRGVIILLFAFVASGSAQNLACTSCHGPDEKRIASPNCGSCHVGTALHTKGELRYSNVMDENGEPRKPADDTFAVNPGKTFDTSLGHGGLKCGACHGDPHTQHTRIVWDCYQCHKVQLPKPEGPHGMHPAGQNWVEAHGLQVDENGTATCIACHGMDRRGTVLSEAFVDRNFKTKFGPKKFAKGTAIGCYSCHSQSGPPK